VRASDVGDLCAARTDRAKRGRIRPCPPVFAVFRVFYFRILSLERHETLRKRSVRSYSRIAKTIIYDRRAVIVSHLYTGTPILRACTRDVEN